MNNEDVFAKQFFRYIHKLAYHTRMDYLRNQCRRNRNEFLFGEFSNEIMEETSSEEFYPSECVDTPKWIAGKLKPEEYDIVHKHSVRLYSVFLQQPDRTDHHIQHSIRVAAHTDKPDPFELCQQLGNLRRYQACIKALVEIYSYILADHALHLLDAMLASQDVIIHENNIPAVRAFDLLPSTVNAFGVYPKPTARR